MIESYTDYLVKRKNLELLKQQLLNERSSFEAHWRDLGDYILPRRPRFYTTDINRGDRRNQKIIDSTATLAARSLRSGMMSGITSPARPWFRLTTPDPSLAEFGSVKEWLFKVQNIISTTFLKSNLYNILPICYGDLGVFGTSPISVQELFTGDLLQFDSYPIGSYMIAKDSYGKVNTFFRIFRMTVSQVVQKFVPIENDEPNWNNVSDYVKNMFEKGQTQEWVEICHVIKPNEFYDEKKLDSKYKKFYSCYYENGVAGSANQNYIQREEKLLSEKGFDFFPILCPRWEVTGEDIYGTSCPGMEALGDIKQLQLGEKRTFEAIEKMIRPPLQGPSTLKNQSVSQLPGDLTYVDSRDGAAGLRPVHEINFNIQAMEMKQGQIRDRIRRTFFEDLFLMLANSDRRQITAREIEERHEEKLLALGPVLEQLNQDLLDPLIEVVFNIHMQRGLLPPPPEELQGVELKVEYISMMAQAQKLIGLSGIERFSGYVGQMASIDPNALDKFNVMQALDVYADITSVPPGLVRTDDEVNKIKEDRQKAQQAQMQAEQAQQAVQGVKELSQTKVGSESALDMMIRNAGGVA